MLTGMSTCSPAPPSSVRCHPSTPTTPSERSALCRAGEEGSTRRRLARSTAKSTGTGAAGGAPVMAAAMTDMGLMQDTHEYGYRARRRAMARLEPAFFVKCVKCCVCSSHKDQQWQVSTTNQSTLGIVCGDAPRKEWTCRTPCDQRRHARPPRVTCTCMTFAEDGCLPTCRTMCNTLRSSPACVHGHHICTHLHTSAHICTMVTCSNAPV